MWTIDRELEQADIMPLLLIINKSGRRMLEKSLVPSAIGITQEELNLAVEKLIKMNIVRRVQSRMLPYTGDLELTEKGGTVASRLAEIQIFLTEKSDSGVDEDLGDLQVARNLAEEKKQGTTFAKGDFVPRKVEEVPVQGFGETRERTEGATRKVRKTRKNRDVE